MTRNLILIPLAILGGLGVLVLVQLIFLPAASLVQLLRLALDPGFRRQVAQGGGTEEGSDPGPAREVGRVAPEAAVVEAVAADAGRSENADARGRAGKPGLKKILVVDDEPLITRSFQRMLAGPGYDVVTTSSGMDGLQQASVKDFDLVITDLRMPDLDGMEIVRAVRRDRPDMAVVVITGYGTAATAAEAMKLGVSDFIAKPFTSEEITVAVEKALAK